MCMCVCMCVCVRVCVTGEDGSAVLMESRCFEFDEVINLRPFCSVPRPLVT